MRLTVSMAILAVTIAPAGAHEWYSTKKVLDPDRALEMPCCDADDCFKVSPQEFSMWMRDRNPLGRVVQNSEDEGHHICEQSIFNYRVHEWSSIVRCAFRPRWLGANPATNSGRVASR